MISNREKSWTIKLIYQEVFENNIQGLVISVQRQRVLVQLPPLHYIHEHKIETFDILVFPLKMLPSMSRER